jgi:hypothetical protein
MIKRVMHRMSKIERAVEKKKSEIDAFLHLKSETNGTIESNKSKEDS